MTNAFIDNVVKAANYINEKIDKLDNAFFFKHYTFHIEDLEEIIGFVDHEITNDIFDALIELFEENGYIVDYYEVDNHFVNYEIYEDDYPSCYLESITIGMPCATVQ